MLCLIQSLLPMFYLLLKILQRKLLLQWLGTPPPHIYRLSQEMSVWTWTPYSGCFCSFYFSGKRARSLITSGRGCWAYRLPSRTSWTLWEGTHCFTESKEMEAKRALNRYWSEYIFCGSSVKENVIAKTCLSVPLLGFSLFLFLPSFITLLSLQTYGT